ncbi:TPA: DNA injection protein [Escherichia coli]|nr:DNA injection protein [Escherichia coli]
MAIGPIDYTSGNGLLQGLQGAGLYQQVQQQKAVAEQAKAAQNAAREFQADWQASFGDPQKMTALAAKYPGQMEAIKAGIGFQDEQHQQALGNAARDLRVAMATNNPQAVQQAAIRHSGVLGTVGSSPGDIVQQFQQDPQSLANIVDAVGMSALGAKDYYGVQNDRAQRQNDIEKLQEQIRSNQAGEALQARGQQLSYGAQMARLNHDKYVYKQSQAALKKYGDVQGMDTLSLNSQIASTGVDPLTGKPATGARMGQARKWLEGNNGYNEALITGERGIEKIDSVLGKPELEGIGRYAGRMPDATTSEEGLSNRNAIEELKSGAFVQNVQMLRGMGSLSNAEGSKLENLIARLDVTQPEDVLRKQLKEIRSQYSVLQKVAGREAESMGYSSQGYDTYVSERQAQREQSGGQQQAAAQGGIPEGATATNQKTGQKIVFRGGQWQAM